MSAVQHPGKAALVATLGLGMALGCGSAQGGNSHGIAVSATILTRIGCSFTSPAQVARSNAGPALSCTASDAATTWRVRSDGGVLTVEP
jgi:hypothetical protein